MKAYNCKKKKKKKKHYKWFNYILLYHTQTARQTQRWGHTVCAVEINFHTNFINKQKLGCASLALTWRICELAQRISGSPPQNLMFEPAFNPEMRWLLFSESVYVTGFIYLFVLFMRIAERSSKRQLVSGRFLHGMAHIIPEQHVNMGIVIISLALYSVRGQRPVMHG